jgi:hypothetical protein
MRTFIGLIILIAFAWLLDVVVFDGRYGQAVWKDAQLQGEKVRNEVRYWLNKTGL